MLSVVCVGLTHGVALEGLRLADGTPNPKLNLKIEFLDTYREMVKLRKAGLCTEIGVCNFTVEQLQLLLEAFPDDPPAVNQCAGRPPFRSSSCVIAHASAA